LDENTYENSTRIAVESLQDLIRYEKEKFPEDPFKQEFLVSYRKISSILLDLINTALINK